MRRTAVTSAQGTVFTDSSRTCRRPRSPTHTPTRTRRTAATITRTATATATPAPGRDPATAMIIAAKSTYEASSNNSAVTPTRHGPGR
ncbi:hypothetical protein SABIM44S_01325 [Streptomyces abikoensis]